MDEKFTPTERRLGPQIDHVISHIGPSMDENGIVPLAKIKEIFLVCARNSGEPPADCEQGIKSAFEILDVVSSHSEEVSFGICVAMMQLGTSMLGAVIESSTQAITREMASLRGINARNKALSDAAERGRQSAKRIWEEDHSQSLRIGEVAQQVYAELHREGLEKVLPKDPDAIRKWIRPIAPGYAMKPGRSKKPS